jgi:malonyl CoA-acyl carrier protein transacylase
MHSRYVQPAEGAFGKYIDTVRFRTPMIPVVGTKTKTPIRTAGEMAEEIKYGFAHTFDNKGIMDVMNDSGVRIISELHPKGIFGKALERTMGAIAVTGDLGISLGRNIIGGVEVLLPHHPQHPKHNGGDH